MTAGPSGPADCSCCKCQLPCRWLIRSCVHASRAVRVRRCTPSLQPNQHTNAYHDASYLCPGSLTEESSLKVTVTSSGLLASTHWCTRVFAHAFQNSTRTGATKTTASVCRPAPSQLSCFRPSTRKIGPLSAMVICNRAGSGGAHALRQHQPCGMHAAAARRCHLATVLLLHVPALSRRAVSSREAAATRQRLLPHTVCAVAEPRAAA